MMMCSSEIHATLRVLESDEKFTSQDEFFL